MRRSAAFRRLSLGIFGLLLGTFMACVHVPAKRGRPCAQPPQDIERILAAASSRCRSLSGHVRVKVTTPRDTFSFSGDLYARMPDRLHFDIFGFLHRPRFVMIRNGSLLYWRDFSSGRYYAGPLNACPPLPVRFPCSPRFLRNLMGILFLRFPPPVRVSAANLPGDPCRFLLRCGWGTFDLTVDPDRGLPVAMVGPLGGETPFRVTLGDYPAPPKAPIPRHVVIAMGKNRVTLTFKTLEVNPSLPDRLFLPLPPP